jgi:hypothetical protein
VIQVNPQSIRIKSADYTDYADLQIADFQLPIADCTLSQTIRNRHLAIGNL